MSEQTKGNVLGFFIIVAVAVAVFSAALVGLRREVPGPITEDSPGWECSTMGNGLCGPLRVRLGPDGKATVSDATGVIGEALNVAYNPLNYLSLQPCETPSEPAYVTVQEPNPSDIREGQSQAWIMGADCILGQATVYIY